MSHHGTTVIPKHEDAILRRVRAYATELQGVVWAVRREREIAHLPTVEWKGHTLYTIRCHGTRGKGPHDCHVAESMLWNLIGLDGYCCVYHRDDQFTPPAERTTR